MMHCEHQIQAISLSRSMNETPRLIAEAAEERKGRRERERERKRKEGLTSIKNELELDVLRVDDLGRRALVRQPHADVLELHEVPLQRVVEPVFECDEVRDLRRTRARCDVRFFF